MTPRPATRIRPASADDRDLLADFLCRLSPEAAYQRFQTVVAGRADRMVADLLPDEPRRGALLAFAAAARTGPPDLVGHAMWGLRAPGIADLGIVVLDQHQRRGVGTLLARALMTDLAVRGIAEVEVFTTTGNRAVARMVARQAPGARHELDGPTLTYRFDTPATVAASLRRTA